MTEKYLELIPESTLETIDNYVTYGYEPGDFVRSVLANDLMQAMGAADIYNRRAIFEICSYIYAYCPSGCHGSYETVQHYLTNVRQMVAKNAQRMYLKHGERGMTNKKGETT